MEELYDRYEKLYCEEEPIEVSLEEWINSIRGIRGQKVIPNNCRDCRTQLVLSNFSVPICPDCGITLECNMDTGYSKRSQAYKRMTHFKDWLTKTQAKHTPCIPKDLIDKCRKCPDKTFKGIKTLLRKNNQTKFYEDIYFILSVVEPSYVPFKLSVHEETLMCCLFMRVQKVWDTVKPLKRKSMISYPFIVSELLDMINRPELKSYFHLPRYNKVLEYKTHFKRIISNPAFYQGYEQQKTTANPSTSYQVSLLETDIV